MKCHATQHMPSRLYVNSRWPRPPTFLTRLGRPLPKVRDCAKSRPIVQECSCGGPYLIASSASESFRWCLHCAGLTLRYAAHTRGGCADLPTTPSRAAATCPSLARDTAQRKGSMPRQFVVLGEADDRMEECPRPGASSSKARASPGSRSWCGRRCRDSRRTVTRAPIADEELHRRL